MATGAKPALDPNVGQTEDAKEPEVKPTTLKGRIMQKLLEIFEHNERLGVTR
jgi:hypothetical protein